MPHKLRVALPSRSDDLIHFRAGKPLERRLDLDVAVGMPLELSMWALTVLKYQEVCAAERTKHDISGLVSNVRSKTFSTDDMP